MALIDLSACFNPYFTSRVRLIHCAETVDGVFAESSINEVSSGDADAIVTADSRTIERLPEALRLPGTISVRYMCGREPEGFRGAGHDRVEWKGKRYTVADRSDGAQFGAGFVRLICHPEEAYD